MDTEWKKWFIGGICLQPLQKLVLFLHFPTILVWIRIFRITDDVAGLEVKFIRRWILSHGFWIRIFRIFRITDDFAGLIFRVKGMGAYILHFADAIIAAAKRKADIFINFMLRHAPYQPTPNAKKSSKSCKSWFKTPYQRLLLKILEILKILIQNPNQRTTLKNPCNPIILKILIQNQLQDKWLLVSKLKKWMIETFSSLNGIILLNSLLTQLYWCESVVYFL